MSDSDTMPDSDDTPNPYPAGFLRRLGIMFYDGVLLIAVLLMASALSLLFLENQPAEPGNPFLFGFFILIALVFYTWFWTHGGQTLGMQTWRVKVETADGKPLSLGHAATRFFSAILSWAPAGLGFLWILVDKDNRAWHDILSGTRMRVYPKPNKG